MRHFLSCMVGLLIFVSIPTFAIDDPLDDILSILEDMEQVQAKMSGDTGNISTNTKEEYDELKDEWAALTRAYGMGDNPNDQNARLWSANDWNSVLEQASGGNADRFQQLMQSYAALYPTLQKGQTQPIDPSKLVNTTYTQSGQTYNAALSSSAYIYDDINNRINKLETILAQVDDANKNQNEKAAIDLNSRLVAELGFIQLEMLKLQSVHTQMEATKDQGELNDDTLDKQFTDYQQP